MSITQVAYAKPSYKRFSKKNACITDSTIEFSIFVHYDGCFLSWRIWRVHERWLYFPFCM